MSTTGGAIIAEMLKREGVDRYFGIIDGTYTSLIVNMKEAGARLFTPRHETTALHMAGSYARLTGRLGVAIASNGPGVANALSGVAVENAEGNRVLLITSSRRTPVGYPDRGGAYQYFDQVGVIRGMSKWSVLVPSIERIPELMRMALRKCWEGRPGVVHVDVPENIVNGDTHEVAYLEPAAYRRSYPASPAPEGLAQAAEILQSARLPMIHAGSGVIHALAFTELEELSHLLHAPVTTSWAARGVMPENDPLAWSMVHIKANNSLRNAADAVLCLGSRMGETDWWGKPPYWAPPDKQKFIQVDLEENAIGRTRPVDLGIVADVKIFLRQLIERLQSETTGGELSKMESRRREIEKLTEEKSKSRRELDKKLEDTGAPMVTGHVSRACRDNFADDAFAVFDGGNTAVWGNFYYEIKSPGTLLTTNHMGHLGAGPGQALGAAAAFPDRQVFCMIGDGAMGFHPQEIETAVRNKLKVIFLVCSDKQWGMVKLTQSVALKPVKTMIKKSLSPEETVNTELGEIEWDKLAESMGAYGERVSDPADLQPAITRCKEAETCAVIHVDVDPVKHMWAPGLMHFKSMHQEPKGK
ncbi:MAG: thiamine pyrophosphate-binding protein [Spirochaetia bacterium]